MLRLNTLLAVLLLAILCGTTYARVLLTADVADTADVATAAELTTTTDESDEADLTDQYPNPYQYPPPTPPYPPTAPYPPPYMQPAYAPPGQNPYSIYPPPTPGYTSYWPPYDPCMCDPAKPCKKESLNRCGWSGQGVCTPVGGKACTRSFTNVLLQTQVCC